MPKTDELKDNFIIYPVQERPDIEKLSIPFVAVTTESAATP
jgi:hypothetical protein